MSKIIKNVIMILLMITLSISTASLIYLHFFASGDKDLSGTWTTELDMTEQAALTALSWLQDIEAVSVSLEDMESYMQGITVQLDMSLEQTSKSGGIFQCNVLPESYDSCNQAAYEAFAAAFRNLLAERLRMSGYTGNIDEEVVETLVIEAFGMSTVAYLMSCGPALLPSLEDLQIQYDGSGIYEVTEDMLTREFDDGRSTARMEYYIRKESSLILYRESASGADGLYLNHYPVIYTLK